MREIRLKDRQEPIELNAELLMQLFGELEEKILNRAIRSSILFKYNIDGGEEFTFEMKISTDRPCDCDRGMKKKNYDSCEKCGGKWSTRKKEAR